MKKLKYYIPTSLQHVVPKIMRYIALLSFIIASMVSGTHAMKPISEYGENQCELIAKDYQREYGGSLIWLQPIDSNGNPIFGEYNAHILNKIYDPVRKEMRYIDYQSKLDTRADHTIRLWNNKPVKMYDLSKERPEFSMIWHY